jgi:DNA-binding SARP family transcriptional activator
VQQAAIGLESVAAQLRELDAKGELAIACWWLAAARRLVGDEPGVTDAVAEAIDLATRYRLWHLLAPHVAATPQLAGESRQAARLIPGAVPDAGTEAPAATIDQTPVPRLAARLFGELRVDVDGAAIPLSSWRSKRAVSLLAILLLRRGQPVHRDEAIEWLWPDTEPERAGKHLNVALSAVRRGLADVAPDGAACVQRLGATYRIRPDTLATLDVTEFETLAMAADGHAARGDLHAALTSAAQALDLVVGELLASEPYAEWAEPERQRLRDRALELRTGVAEWHLSLGQPRDAIREAAVVLAAERWRERAWRVAIDAHVALGDRSAALQSLNACHEALREELGVQPSPALRSLAAQLRA